MTHSNLALVTAPAILPISVEDAKAQVRETSDGHNDKLYDAIAQATSHLENISGNRLVEQVWDVWFPCFGGDFIIPIGPVISLDTFEYTDEDNTTTAVASSVYQLQSKNPPWCSRVYLKPDQEWPTATLWTRDAVHMRVTVGWADEETVDATEANTTTTNLVMTAHGLTDLDTIVNTTKSSAQRTVRYVDADNLTVEAVTGQGSTNAIRKFNTSKIPAVFRKQIKEMVGTQFEMTDDVVITPAGSALQEMPPWAARTYEPFKIRGV